VNVEDLEDVKSPEILSPTISISTASTLHRLVSGESVDSGAPVSSVTSGVSAAFRDVIPDEDGLTTVMIRNIPCKYKQSWLMEEISAISSNYDFLYMPPARKDGGSKGYAFVNFGDEETAAKFIAEFQGHSFYRQPNSLKRADVGYAEVQGLVKNVKFYKRSKAIKSRFHPYIKRSALKQANRE